MGIYSFDGGSLWTNEGPEDETPGYYLEHHNPSRDGEKFEAFTPEPGVNHIDYRSQYPIELDINDPNFDAKVVPAVDELTRRANVRFPGIDHWKSENIGPENNGPKDSA